MLPIISINAATNKSQRKRAVGAINADNPNAVARNGETNALGNSNAAHIFKPSLNATPRLISVLSAIAVIPVLAMLSAITELMIQKI